MLKPIPQNEDLWIKRHAHLDFGEWLYSTELKTEPFIATAHEGDSPEFSLRPEKPENRTRTVSSTPLSRSPRTLLSRVETVEYAHAFAVRQGMRRWKLLRFTTSSLSQPNYFGEDVTLTSSGANLPATLARMESEDNQVLSHVSRDLSRLVSSIQKVYVESDEGRGQFVLQTLMRDGRIFSGRVLSEGILRMLALATLRNDPRQEGVLCLEDPETGVHPATLKKLVYLLRDMTSDFSETVQANHWKQMIVTTHSPELVSELDLEAGELIFAELVTRMTPGMPPMQVTRMTPVGQEVKNNQSAKSYTLNQVIKYLNTANYEPIRSEIRKISA